MVACKNTATATIRFLLFAKVTRFTEDEFLEKGLDCLSVSCQQPSVHYISVIKRPGNDIADNNIHPIDTKSVKIQ